MSFTTPMQGRTIQVTYRGGKSLAAVGVVSVTYATGDGFIVINSSKHSFIVKWDLGLRAWTLGGREVEWKEIDGKWQS